MTCPTCGSGKMSTPMKGRHTGKWFATCRACISTHSFDSRPDFPAPEPPPIRHRQDAPLEYEATTVPMVRVGTITPQELSHINANDPKLKAAGDE